MIYTVEYLHESGDATGVWAGMTPEGGSVQTAIWKNATKFYDKSSAENYMRHFAIQNGVSIAMLAVTEHVEV